MKLELGCGLKTDPEVFGIDIRPLPGVDLVWDLEQVPLPLPDACCTEIVSSHVLEHIRNLIPLMNDCYRLLKPGGLFRAVVPQACDSRGDWHAAAFQDPTHVRFFVPATWSYFIADRAPYRYGELYGILSWEHVAFVDRGWVATTILRKPLHSPGGAP